MISSNYFRSAECIKPTTRNREASEFLKLSEQKKTSRFSSHSTWNIRTSDFSTDDLRCLLSDDLILSINIRDTPTPEQSGRIHNGTSKNNEIIRHNIQSFSADMGKLTATHFVNNRIRKGADNQSQDQYYWPTSGTTEFSELRSDCWHKWIFRAGAARQPHCPAQLRRPSALSSGMHHFSTYPDVPCTLRIQSRKHSFRLENLDSLQNYRHPFNHKSNYTIFSRKSLYYTRLIIGLKNSKFEFILGWMK